MSAPYFDSNESPDDPAGDLYDRILLQNGLSDRLSRIAVAVEEDALDVSLDAITVLLDVVEAALHEIEGHVGNRVALPSHIEPLPTGQAASVMADAVTLYSPAWRLLNRLARA